MSRGAHARCGGHVLGSGPQRPRLSHFHDAAALTTAYTKLKRVIIAHFSASDCTDGI